MADLRKIEYRNKIIFVIDYSDLNEGAMKALVTQLKLKVLEENNSQLFLSVFNEKNFLTPGYMRHVEKETSEILHLIDKIAIVGMTTVQRQILKGYNFLLKRNFLAFDTQQEAMDYLVGESNADEYPAQR